MYCAPFSDRCILKMATNSTNTVVLVVVVVVLLFVLGVIFIPVASVRSCHRRSSCGCSSVIPAVFVLAIVSQSLAEDIILTNTGNSNNSSKNNGSNNSTGDSTNTGNNKNDTKYDRQLLLWYWWRYIATECDGKSKA